MKDEVVLNTLGHDGMRKIKIIGDDAINPERYRYLIPAKAAEKAVFEERPDPLLNIHSLEISFPVYGPHDVFYPSPKGFRRFMFVHFDYARRVSDCIKLARDGFISGTGFPPMYAYVATLPSGADEWMVVHGCELFVAEWMPSNCVAVGGCDVE